LLTTGALTAAGFFTGAAALTTFVVFAAAGRPGLVALAAGLVAFFGAALAMMRHSFVGKNIHVNADTF
jgi:hypothetical protein